MGVRYGLSSSSIDVHYNEKSSFLQVYLEMVVLLNQSLSTKNSGVILFYLVVFVIIRGKNDYERAVKSTEKR